MDNVALNTGDIAFILVSAAMVVLMTPGLGLFYSGLGRRKNTVNNMFASVFNMATGAVLWIVFGYSLTFTGDTWGIFGTFSDFCLSSIDLTAPSSYSPSITGLTFVAFQMSFVLITPSIVTGSVSGRMRFPALFWFIVLWNILVYYPVAHMVWGSGGLLGADGLKSIDFAGGNVVHISSGVSGLVLCLVVGRRQGYDNTSYRVHNIPFVLLGTALLWFGWYGFNGGSVLAANGLTAHVFLTTTAAAAAAMLSWILVDIIRKRKPSLISACTGVVAGLVGITPAAGFVPMWASLVIGFTVGPICYLVIMHLKKALKFDDALDAFGCHGVGGIWGGLLTGLFASPAVNGQAGLFYGNPKQLLLQIVAILASILVAVVGTLICAGVVRLFTPLRVEKRDEAIGLDATQHAESAYPSFNGLD
jgi:Amt family ammonium transporter